MSTFLPYSQQNVDRIARGRVVSTKCWLGSPRRWYAASPRASWPPARLPQCRS
jgi:hypothetical protein